VQESALSKRVVSGSIVEVQYLFGRLAIEIILDKGRERRRGTVSVTKFCSYK
jgi:hypothetical protein